MEPRTVVLEPDQQLSVLAANLRRLRAELRWSARAFAEHAGLSRAYLRRIEDQTHQTVSLGTLDKLASGLGVTVDVLLSTDGRRTAATTLKPAIDMVSENVRARRKALKWTQSELALRADLPATVISEIETRRRNISIAILGRVAITLSIEPHQLLLDHRPGSK